MMKQTILKLLRMQLRWREQRGAWVLYAGWIELCYLEMNVQDGQLYWLLCIWHLPDDGWHAVDFDGVDNGIAQAEKWAAQSGFGRLPSKGSEAVVMRKFFQKS